MSSIDPELQKFYEGGPKSWNEAFPSPCYKTHWDPTAVTKYILPQEVLPLPQDLRVSSRTCYQYYTTESKDGDVAETSKNMVFPPGGKAGSGFPYATYAANVDKETDVLRIDEPLTRCAEKRYIPPNAVPDRSTGDNRLPGVNPRVLDSYATVVRTRSGCREEDDAQAWNRSARLFFNPTKYDRTAYVAPAVRHSQAQGYLACPLK